MSSIIRPRTKPRKVKKYNTKVKKTIHKLEREEHDKLQVHIDYLKFATKYAVEKFEEYESDLNGGDDEIDDIKNKKPSYVFYNDTKKRNRSSNNNNNKALTVDIDSSNFGLARDDNNDNYSNNDLNDENVTPSTSSVLNALDHLKSFVVGSPKLRNAIGTTTPLLPSLVSFISTLQRTDHGNKHNLLLVRALETVEVLLHDNYKCIQYLANEVDASLECLVRVLGNVRELTRSWEGMQVLDRISLVLLYIVTLGDEARSLFFKAKGGAALLLSVDILCSVAKRQIPEPIYRRGFDVSADSWVQLAKRVCGLIVEAGASEKISNKSNLRALHKAGVFGSLCRWQKTLMRRPGGNEKSGSSNINSNRGPSPFLTTPYAKDLILAINALLAGERDYQRTYLDTGMVPLLVHELFRSWVNSWLGATIPELDEDGEDGYTYFGSPEESKRVRGIAADAYSTYASLQLLLAALQYDFTDATDEVEKEIEKASVSDLLETCVMLAIDEVGGSVVESFQYQVIREELYGNENNSRNRNNDDNTSQQQDDNIDSTATASKAKQKMMKTLDGNITNMNNQMNNISLITAGASSNSEINSNISSSSNNSNISPTINNNILSIKILLASGVTIEPPRRAVSSCARWYSTIMDESRDLHLYHYDEEACVYSLNALEQVLQEGTEVQHFFINIRGAVELLVQNVNQIAESVMRAACAATHSLLLGNSITQQAFLKRAGLRALSDCLHDYDIKVRLLALQSIAILCSKQEQCLDEVRKTGILEHVVSILNDFPADDVNVEVAIAAADVLAHCVNDNVANQALVQNNNGLATLFKVFQWCVRWRSTEYEVGMPLSPKRQRNAWGIASVLENVCAALSNLAYRNQSNQEEMLKNGTLALCVSTLCNRAGTSFNGFKGIDSDDGIDKSASLPCRPLELTVAILNIVINGVDANPSNQTAVGIEDTVVLLSLFMGPIDTVDNGATTLGLPLFEKDVGMLQHMSSSNLVWHLQRVAAMSCLLLSHLAWDNAETQSHLGKEDKILQLVNLVDTGSTFQNILKRNEPMSSSPSAAENRSGPPSNGTNNNPNSNSTENNNTHNSVLSGVGDGIFSVDEDLAGKDEVRLYALMALINLSYHNILVQNSVNSLRLEDQRTAFEVILQTVSSDLFDVRKAAVFCLDNLVTSHRENSKLLANAGGVLSLVALLNDDEDDEVSKKAFRTLTSMSDIAMSVILSHVAALSYGIDDVKGIGSGLKRQGSMPEMPKAALDEIIAVANQEQAYYLNLDTSDGAGVKTSEWEDGLTVGDSTETTTNNNDNNNAYNENDGGERSNLPVTTTEIVWGMLGKLLPVINGIVYNDGNARNFLWKTGSGIPILLHIMTRVLPLDLRVVASYIVSNVTQNTEPELQALALEMGALGVFNAFLKEIDQNNDSDGEESANKTNDSFGIIFTALQNLLKNNIDNTQQLAKPEFESLLVLIIKCCRQNLNTELRNDAAIVLLTISELAIDENGALQKRLVEEDVDAALALQTLSESFDSSLTHQIKQRAEKCYRALTNRDSKK